MNANEELKKAIREYFKTRLEDGDCECDIMDDLNQITTDEIVIYCEQNPIDLKHL